MTGGNILAWIKVFLTVAVGIALAIVVYKLYKAITKAADSGKKTISDVIDYFNEEIKTPVVEHVENSGGWEAGFVNPYAFLREQAMKLITSDENPDDYGEYSYSVQDVLSNDAPMPIP